ncbi:MAG: glycosyltransferase [Rhodocyclaceae bacterium]|nr:glycosyltransferase [Rhodocyclaceae bacterium]
MSANKPRVLFVLPATVMGGAEIRLLNMLGAFSRIEPVLLAHRALPGMVESGQAAFFLDDYTQHPDPNPFDVRNIVRHARAVRAVARQCQPDLTFGWLHHGAMFVRMAKWMGMRGRTAGCVLGPPQTYYRNLGVPPSRSERFFFCAISRWLDVLVTPSQGVREELIAHFHGKPQRIRAIYNGIDLARAQRLAAASDVAVPPKTRLRMVSAGRLGPDKGFGVLLEALGRLVPQVDCELMLLGEGELRGQLEARARELGVAERLLLPGHVDNPFPYYASADVFAFASRFEGFGNVLVEAMALGLPMVSSACPYGPREIFAKPGSGLLTEVDNVDSTTQALARVLGDPELAAELARGARARAEDFSFARMCREYEDVILAVLDGETTGGAAASV